MRLIESSANGSETVYYNTTHRGAVVMKRHRADGDGGHSRSYTHTHTMILGGQKGRRCDADSPGLRKPFATQLTSVGFVARVRSNVHGQSATHRA